MTDCTRFESDGMRYIDGEMNAAERTDFERHCADCGDCRRSLDAYAALDSLTRRVKMVDPTDAFWERYWRSLYRRVERRTAWVLILAGAAMLLLFALQQIVVSLREVTFEKIAVALLAAGFVLLLVSVARERAHQKKVDPYRDVQR